MSSCSQNIRKTSDNEYILNDEQLLGNGISGDVYRCLDSKTGKEYAIKIFKKNYNNSHEIKMNKRIKEIGNPSLAKYIDSSNDFIVFDFYEKGDLMKYFKLVKKDKLMKFIIFKILKSVQILHKHGICHRDLKPDNIFLAKDFSLKIGDFGQCLSFLNQNNEKILISGDCGTLKYRAPETYGRNFYDGEKIDIFSIGVILFSIKIKVCPFPKASPNDFLYKYIKNKDEDNYWKIYGKMINLPHLSKEFKKLFFKMVSFNPNERPTIEEILKDPWLAEITSLDENGLELLEKELIKEFKECEEYF